MRKKPILITLVCLSLLLTTCIGSAAASSDNDQKSLEKSIAQALTQSGIDLGKNPTLLSTDNKLLSNNIHEYVYILKVGDGPHDFIGVHRVVKDRLPFVPIKADKAVMMIPGDSCDFHSAFLLPSDRDRSMAVYLAKNNIDVWGIDLRWTFITPVTSDFSFMKSWNTDTHLGDIRMGVRFARTVRALTGSGKGKIFMLGHSRGAQFVYAYANNETQLPAGKRDLCGIIPMDMVYKFAPQDQALQNAAYARYQAYKTIYDAGKYYSDDGLQMKVLASLAGIAPDAPSKAVPGMTNMQAALFALTSTYATVIPPLQSITPYYHYLAGTFDAASGLPTGLRYADPQYIIRQGIAAPPYQSLGEMIDGEALMSDAVDVPYDDHLQEITIPVLYVGAAGGMGAYGTYTPTLLGSKDKSTVMVQLEATGSEALDFGHADLIWSNNAPSLVWQPIRKWIQNH
ncbi:MAG TPA: hypothetical protein VN426_16510 [Syntrophomonadaceae bacterium]|nr:hypothetical protein [Syntrophomonadaceae bacterium]